jgi:hypothetical protein
MTAVRVGLLNPLPGRWAHFGEELASAVQLVAAVEAEIRTGGPPDAAEVFELAAELRTLRRDLKKITQLMDAAADSYLGWSQLLAAALGGYSARGTVIPLHVEARISVQG